MKVWDLHCDTLSELRRAEKAGLPKSFGKNDLHIDLEKLQKGSRTRNSSNQISCAHDR